MSDAAVAVPPPRRRVRRNWVPYALLAPGLLWLVVFFVVPTVSLVSQSLQTGDVFNGYTLTWNVQTYVDALGTYWPQLLRSLVYAGLATVFTLLLGYPLAWFIAHRSGRLKNVLLVLVIAPFFTSFLIRTLAWQTILGNGGLLETTMGALHLTWLLHGFESFLGLVNLGTGNQLLYTPFAVVAGLTYNFLPFMVLPLYANIERLDLRLVEAASDLYATPASAFRRVIWPLSLPGVVAGTLLTFIPATGDYINSVLLGSTQTVMIGQVIDSQFLRVLNYPLAAALSVALMALIITFVTVYVRRAGTEELV
ncbi:ABC transporter permease [Phycicoccus duodecadis]|uniref:Spermidine/putrescine transport system permease protein n=1 Tax=Phycicoccus duodecadis TaxID=173053 RepID=A0A2N3YG45_9MICO|nr:ABC transporter permease [Phycicoccus duodecadis]PKW25837.1 spermidine/putrescine transport system permease protein [Phycicoccus duodecadis]